MSMASFPARFSFSRFSFKHPFPNLSVFPPSGRDITHYVLRRA